MGPGSILVVNMIQGNRHLVLFVLFDHGVFAVNVKAIINNTNSISGLSSAVWRAGGAQERVINTNRIL